MRLNIPAFRRYAIILLFMVLFFLIGLMKACGVIAATWQNVLDAYTSAVAANPSCKVWIKYTSSNHYELYKRCNGSSIQYQYYSVCDKSGTYLDQSYTSNLRCCNGTTIQGCSDSSGSWIGWHWITYSVMCDGSSNASDNSVGSGGICNTAMPRGFSTCNIGGATNATACTSLDSLLSSYDITDSCTAALSYNSSGGVYGYIAPSCTCTPSGTQYSGAMSGYCGDGSVSTDPWLDYKADRCQNKMCVYVNITGDPTGNGSGKQTTTGITGGTGTNPGDNSLNISTSTTNTSSTVTTNGTTTTTTTSTSSGSGTSTITTTSTSSAGTTTTQTIATYPTATISGAYSSVNIGAYKTSADFAALFSNFTASVQNTAFFSNYSLMSMLPSGSGSPTLTVNLGSKYGTYTIDLSAEPTNTVLTIIGCIMFLAAGLTALRILFFRGAR